MSLLRIRMKGRETVFERTIAKRELKETIEGHMQMWGRETVTIDGKPVQREVPKDIWLFEWVNNPGTPSETVEPITVG